MKKNVRNALKKLDIVKLSLDSVHPKVFKKIDRPMGDIRVEEIIEDIKEFNKIFCFSQRRSSKRKNGC